MSRGELAADHPGLQCSQTFPDLQGRRQLVVQMVHSGVLTSEPIVHLVFKTGKAVVDLVVQSLDLDFDARQSFPEIADARRDGFLEDLLDRFEG